MKINSVNTSLISMGGYDPEYEQIKRRLMQYGLRPSGNKAVDKSRLHAIELEKAKAEPCVTNKFLTVTKSEQEKIQAEKEEKKIENNPEVFADTAKGQKILGEQIMIAIEMKQKKEL